MADGKIYNLEERSEKFSLTVRDFCVNVKKDVINIEYIKQLIRAADSVGANYIEVNDNVGAKDAAMKFKICKREAKESRYWLRHILSYGNLDLEATRCGLLKEAEELMLIFCSYSPKTWRRLEIRI
ncbi:four helix bundle protein [Niabella ginsengisoli]|uniref:Four helix bundle protein n=1 Tax=Niabella ginsengisoli TaxID=522298 RepID=A0ABS9SFY7_9BACT|nr:four helix bundle protein [Niabella ginsengisoli]MCH5597278.1 four helix bundle protein [Niabella ginsengisoli]